jgi:phage baseplate assembly protein W
MRVILTTRPGELLLHPDFGAGLDQFLAEPIDLTLRARIAQRVRSSLERWETRISVDRVDVAEVEGAPTQLRVDIGYRLTLDGTSDSLAFTLHTEA